MNENEIKKTKEADMMLFASALIIMLIVVILGIVSFM